MADAPDTGTPLTAEQQTAQAQLDAIYADHQHAYNLAGHPRWEQARDEVLGLRRLVQGAANRTVEAYREDGDGAPVARPAPVSISASYNRDDFLAAVPGDWGTPEARRTAAAVEQIGATWFEGQVLVNATLGPPPPPEDELDLTAVWGDAVDANVRAVNRLLTQLRAVDADLHDRMLPFIQRRANVANRVLAIAKRLAR